MKMKKLLATALVLLMSMMACVPAFAEGWPNTITETIDCTRFTGDKTGSGWEWDHATKTLKITDDLLIKITQKTGNDNYGIILPDEATLEIPEGKRLYVAIVSDGTTYGIGDCVYSTGEITIKGTLEAGRQGGDIFAVAANKVILSDGAQIEANSCIGGVVTPELVVNGDNAILADYWCIVQFNGKVKITGSGALTLDCGDTPIRCNKYTVDPTVKLKFNPIPVPKERITPTIPGSLTDGVTPADGSLTVSIGEMSSDAWAAAIREALKDSSSGEISSIGFGVKVTPPQGAAKMMYYKNIEDEQFSEMVLNSNEKDWVEPSEFGGWEFTLANVAKDDNGDYTVTPSQKNEYIYIAWKNDEGKVIRVEKLNVVVGSTPAAPITVSKEQVDKPAEKPSGSGSGSGSSVWYRGGNSLGASIPSDPTEVLIDGVSVPFTVDGNTITIPSLTDGPHNVKVIWRGGSYSFNITASGTGKSIVALPKTGDSSMGPYVGLCMLVFMGMLAGGAVLNRKKAK